jgi:RNA 3'-terminal phosphate cyclase (ATP)
MLEIDGSRYSGSGTLLRYAVALATLVKRPLRMIRIRARRPKPGLRAQHMQAITACAALSGSRVEGAEIGSQEIIYAPGDEARFGEFHFDIGTAGSACMAAFTLIPAALFAGGPSRISIVGGLFQDFAPCFFHMQRVLLPLVERMGVDVRLDMVRPGYVPKGNGELVVNVSPAPTPLKPLRLGEQGKVQRIRGISLASHLSDQEVARRMADRCESLLKRKGYSVDLEIVEDSTAIQRGAALTLWASTSSGCVIGSDRAGKIGRKSEAIADYVARSLQEDLESGATVDRHVADQLILFAALADGTTQYRIPAVTDHVESNLWLVKTILGAASELEGNLLTIHGIGYSRAAAEVYTGR